MKTFLKTSLVAVAGVHGNEADRRYFARPLKPVDTTGMKTDLVDVPDEDKFTQFLKKSAPFGCDLRKREYRVASTEGKSRIHCAICPPSYVYAAYFAVGSWNPTAECLSPAKATARIGQSVAAAQGDLTNDKIDLAAGDLPNKDASGPVTRRMLQESSSTLHELRQLQKAGGSKLRKLSGAATISDDMRFLPSWSFTTEATCLTHDDMFHDGEKCRPCDINRRQYRKGGDPDPDCKKCSLSRGFFFTWRVHTFNFVCDSADDTNEAAAAVFGTGFFKGRTSGANYDSSAAGGASLPDVSATVSAISSDLAR